jgi:F-type H+-transporting ATPase subunit epsilon
MFDLSVVTPQGPVLEAQVDEMTAPGVLGEFGVLQGHIPFVSAVKTGVLSWRRGGERGRLAVGPGFVEVDVKGAVTAVLQRAVPGDKVDPAAAEGLQKDAEGRLKKAGTGGDQGQAELARAQEDLSWAQAQLQAQSPGKSG